jgi:hypothetical protein
VAVARICDWEEIVQLIVLVFLVIGLSTSANATNLLGKSVLAEHRFDTPDRVDASATTLITNDASDTMDMYLGMGPQGRVGYLVNLDTSRLEITIYANQSTYFSEGSHNGLVLTSTSLNIPAVLSSISVGQKGGFYFTADRVSKWGDNALLFDFRGLTVFNGFGFVATFDNGAAVPEPEAWSMMVVGFGLVGASVRRSRSSHRRRVGELAPLS